MKLYYKPGACSLSPHIVAREADLPVELVKVERGKPLPDGRELLQLNSKGQVPTLELDDGSVLTEGAAIVQYLADQKPDADLVPRAGTIERYRLAEWLNFIASEVHKGYSPLFNPKTPDDYKEILKGNLLKKYEWVAQQLEGKPYLMGERFSVADAYLYTVTRWGQKMSFEFPAAITAYQERVAARPKVREALATEGLS